MASILIALLFSLLHRDKAERGEFIQAAYRSSAAILGIAFVKNIYGEATMAALMIVGTVPLYNIIAVIVLSLTASTTDGISKTNRKALLIKTLKNVVTNPIILGIVVGMLWSFLKIPQPVILSKPCILSRQYGNAAFINSTGCIVSMAGCQGKTASNDWHYLYQIGPVLRIVFATCSCLWFPNGKVDCNFGHAWQCYYGQLFCNGTQHGA